MYRPSMTLWIILMLDLTAVTLLNAAAIDGLEKETGELTLSQDQFTQLTSGESKSIEVRKTADHQYTALNPIADDGIPQPIGDCWERFDQYVAMHLVAFQAWANRYCRPFQGCWRCPYFGLYIAFSINPIRFCDLTASQTYSETIRVFEL